MLKKIPSDVILFMYLLYLNILIIFKA